ncbi:hypothetical protein ACFWNG_05170 [Streptomyces sp. NPDC058391]|uniref:hypothetical protein n=1 Tax=Streptomyces sp. NPDC058391 TaxID=3346476 RepID=UPI00364A0724
MSSRGSAVEANLVTLTDHIGVLTHHLDYALGRAQDRFTATETVYPPERRTLAELAEATVGITGALNLLAEALAHATSAIGSAGRVTGHAPPSVVPT